LFSFFSLLYFSSFSLNMLKYLEAIYLRFYLLWIKEINLLHLLIERINLPIRVRCPKLFIFWKVFDSLHFLLDYNLNQIIIDLLLPLFVRLNLILVMIKFIQFNPFFLLKLYIIIFVFETYEIFLMQWKMSLHLDY